MVRQVPDQPQRILARHPRQRGAAGRFVGPAEPALEMNPGRKHEGGLGDVSVAGAVGVDLAGAFGADRHVAQRDRLLAIDRAGEFDLKVHRLRRSVSRNRKPGNETKRGDQMAREYPIHVCRWRLIPPLPRKPLDMRLRSPRQLSLPVVSDKTLAREQEVRRPRCKVAARPGEFPVPVRIPSRHRHQQRAAAARPSPARSTSSLETARSRGPSLPTRSPIRSPARHTTRR